MSITHLEPATNFSLSFFDYVLDSFEFVDVGRPPWREIGSVLFSFCRALPAQPFSDLSPTGLTSIVYCLYLWDPPQPGGPGSCIYFPQKQGSPVIALGIGFEVRMLSVTTHTVPYNSPDDGLSRRTHNANLKYKTHVCAAVTLPVLFILGQPSHLPLMLPIDWTLWKFPCRTAARNTECSLDTRFSIIWKYSMRTQDSSTPRNG
jgi:hypothetical protein